MRNRHVDELYPNLEPYRPLTIPPSTAHRLKNGEPNGLTTTTLAILEY